MNINDMIKTSFGAAALVAVVLSASTAGAQAVSDDEAGAVSDEIMDQAAQRLGEEAEAEDEREIEDALEEQDEMTREEYEDAQMDMTPEELDQLRQELEAQNEQMIQQLDDIIEGSPQNPQRPEWMFQKAELMWELRNTEYIRERNQYNACMDAVYEGTRDEDQCDEPEPDYGEAQDIYESILQEFPDYARLDEVIFRLGSGLLDADEGAQAVQYLNRLVNDYPNSQYIADTYLALGDYWFEEHMTGNARNNYEEVLAYDNYRNYDYALYQLGWTEYNAGENRDSVERFKQVIERAEESDGAWGLLADRATNDMMRGLAQLPDGWIEARDYFTDLRGIEFAYEQLDTMASHLEAQGRDEQVVQLYDWFIEERPDHQEVPEWIDGITRAVRDIDFDAYEERVVDFADYLHPDHTWYRRNQENERALQRADRWVENNLQRLGVHYHSEAQEEGNDEYYAQAAEYYQQFIDRFPDHHVSFDMTFSLGEIYLHSLERYAEAAENYQHVVDLYQDENVPEEADEESVAELVRAASYNVVVSYNNLVREHHPESILVDMADRAGEDPEMTAEGIDEVTDEEGDPEEPEREDLLEWEEGFVQASDQFSEMYPNEDVTPTVDYVAAEVYRDRGHFDNCIPRYENIIENAPEHTYASFAGNSLLEANYRLQNWDAVERWARHLIENEIFDVTPEDSLESAIAYAINERAFEYMDEGEDETGAEELMALAEEFPESEFAAGALFNSAAVYEQAEEINRAAEIYDRVVQEYPDSEETPQALVALGEIFEARTDFERAADHWVRLAEEDYRDYTAEEGAGYSADEAVFNAAVLREAMEDWDVAISTYELYLDVFDDEIELGDRQEVEYNLAYLEQQRDQYQASRDRLEAYLEEYEDDVSLDERVESYAEIATIIQRLEEDGWEDESVEYYERVLDLWEDEERWAEEHGEEAGDLRHATRHEAAEAIFQKTEFTFQDFREVELSFPPDTLAETAEEKAQYLTDAEAEYNRIIAMGLEDGMPSPEWIAAASYRIGQGYRDFADALFNLPIPDDVPPEREFEYELSVEDLAAPLEEQSLAAFQRALDLALNFQAYNEWSARSADEISDLESRAYPITSQDGVYVEHNRIDFFAPETIRALDTVRERGAERRERLAPDEGPVLDPDHPDYTPELDPDAPEFIEELDPNHPEHDPQLKQRMEEEYDIELDILFDIEDDDEADDDEAVPQANAVGWTP